MEELENKFKSRNITNKSNNDDINNNQLLETVKIEKNDFDSTKPTSLTKPASIIKDLKKARYGIWKTTERFEKYKKI